MITLAVFVWTISDAIGLVALAIVGLMALLLKLFK